MKVLLSIIVSLGLSSMVFGDVNISADVFNRYVWRGTDFGNAVSIQPSIEYSSAYFTLGAWSAWAINGAAGGNENDLYVSTAAGPLTLTVTDYFFPSYQGADDIFTLDNHVLEVSVGGTFSDISGLVATNISGDDDHSTYLELGYRAFTLGMGSGGYVTNGSDFTVVNVAVNATKDIFSASYVINPEQKTSFLVFGISL